LSKVPDVRACIPRFTRNNIINYPMAMKVVGEVLARESKITTIDHEIGDKVESV